jgi:hypothetical protein
MTSKMVGGILIVALILLTIFLIKFIPYYQGASKLETFLNECMSNYQGYGEEGCRVEMKKIVADYSLAIDPVAGIKMDIAVQKEGSTISADWDQPIDFFGAYTYVHHFHVEHTGRPPDRR